MNGRKADAPLRFLARGATAPGRVEGRLLSGAAAPGDRVVLVPGGGRAAVLAAPDGGTVLTLDPPVEVRAGQVVADADAPPEYADHFSARIDWLGREPLLPGRVYALEAGCGRRRAAVSRLRCRIEPGTGKRIAADTLAAGESGVANVALDAPLAFDPEAACPATGAFLLRGGESGEPAARGGVRHGLRRAVNVPWQALAVDRAGRAAIKGQRPAVAWLTGLSGAGKSTIANLVEKELLARSRHTYLLDGDNLRHGLNRDLGFTDADRVENIRRAAETARLMVDAGLIVIASFISPFRSERSMARALFERGEFVEVFVDAPLAVCERRDPKGLYRKARAGGLANFTGIDSPYETPERPEMVVDTVAESAERAARRIVDRLDPET